MLQIRKYVEGIVHLGFPHICLGCGSDAIDIQNTICFRCMAKLPKTNFATIPDNKVERVFTGRTEIVAATAMYYFTKDSMLQHLMHLLKYKNKPEVGNYLGRELGRSIKESNRFDGIDYIIPVPLSKKRQAKRGYNQAMEISKGISEMMQIPIADNITYRAKDNETQTNKTRQERWENMQNVFAIEQSESLQNKNVLLIDDVVTTGATLETCALALKNNAQVNIYIATLAIAMS